MKWIVLPRRLHSVPWSCASGTDSHFFTDCFLQLLQPTCPDSHYLHRIWVRRPTREVASDFGRDLERLSSRAREVQRFKSISWWFVFYENYLAIKTIFHIFHMYRWYFGHLICIELVCEVISGFPMCSHGGVKIQQMQGNVVCSGLFAQHGHSPGLSLVAFHLGFALTFTSILLLFGFRSSHVVTCSVIRVQSFRFSLQRADGSAGEREGALKNWIE